MDHCDYGWIHSCGGPHDVPEGDDRTVVVPISPDGCKTYRCDTHCSCFIPDDVHVVECALGGVPNG